MSYARKNGLKQLELMIPMLYDSAKELAKSAVQEYGWELAHKHSKK